MFPLLKSDRRFLVWSVAVTDYYPCHISVLWEQRGLVLTEYGRWRGLRINAAQIPYLVDE